MKGETQRNEDGSFFRVLDAEGRVLADCLAERQARHFVRSWNGRPIAQDLPVRLVEMDVHLAGKAGGK